MITVLGSAGGEEVKRPVDFFRNVIVKNQSAAPDANSVDYQVGIDYEEAISAGQTVSINFVVHNVYNQGVELEPYLGADMHLAVVKDDLKVYIHTHPSDHEDHEDESSDGHTHSMFRIIPEALAHGVIGDSFAESKTVPFEVIFPQPGTYKMFAQFRPKGIELPADQSLVGEFYIKVGGEFSKENSGVMGGQVASDGHTDHAHSSVEGTAHLHEDGSVHTHEAAVAPLGKPLMVLLSLVLMIMLSLGVRKFVQVKSK